MENTTIRDIVRACGGRLLCGDENKVIRHFSIDSRTGDEDSIFVPIIGERVDAHRFIEGALAINGATFTSEHDSPLPGPAGQKPWIRVDDTVDAMQKVGTWYRNRMDLPLVAVTGSVGKTTTREMISTVLASQKKVFQTRGNQNSQIGVPLTLSQISGEDEIAVLEIGMSERGQIEKLTTMIRPNIAVVTLIGVSHIAQLKSQENICLEKMDIVKGLQEGGQVFLNGDDPFLAPYKGNLDYPVWLYGLGENCDYRAENIHVKKGKTFFDFVCEGKKIPVTLASLGDHNVRNALAGLGIAHRLGLDMKKAAEALEGFHGQRLKILSTEYCTLIDDTYNASPDSMKASARVLSAMEDVRGRRVAGLADMLELGEKEKEYHYEVGRFLAGLNLDEVVLFGDLSREIERGIRDHAKDDIPVRHFEDRETMKAYLMKSLSPEDVLLLKGSNGMRLSGIVKELIGE